jgi:Homeodomain-like domain-containing protein
LIMRAMPIELTLRQRELLDQISRSRTSKQAHAERARIILLSAEGKSNYQIGKELGVSAHCASKWRERWRAKAAELTAAEAEEDKGAYKKRVLELLDDASRPGCPEKFTAEQICQMLSVACEAPEESEHPLSHWSLTSLIAEVVRREIVEGISKSQMHVFLKSCGHQATQGKDVDSHPRRRCG